MKFSKSITTYFKSWYSFSSIPKNLISYIFTMNTIINNHNQRVKPEDWVFFLGDFAFKNSKGGKEGEGLPIKATDLVKQLNGKFVFVKGNHDRNNSLKTIIERCIIKYGNYRINLVHNPEFIDKKYPINLVGHVHTNWKFKRFRFNNETTDAINVGVDMWNFKPVTFEEIYSQYSKWKKTNESNIAISDSN
jgi:calcineurin-like phosphoesterase family protein